MVKKYIQIPLDFSNSGYMTETCNVNGRMFQFRFLFNQVDNFFYMDVKTNKGERLGIKCIPESTLLDESSGLFDGKGRFIILRQSTQLDKEFIDFFDFGNGWDLFFLVEE